MYNEQLPVTGLSAIAFAGFSLSFFHLGFLLLLVGVALSLAVRFTGRKDQTAIVAPFKDHE